MKHLTALVMLFAVVVFSKTAAELSYVSYAVQNAQEIRHLICDLAPEPVVVTCDGQPIQVDRNPNDAPVSFTSSSGGHFTVAVGACRQPNRPQWTE